MDKRGRVTEMTAQNIVLATGLRPRYPDIPGAKEYGITRYMKVYFVSKSFYRFVHNSHDSFRTLSTHV